MNKSLGTFLKIALPLGLGVFLIWYTYSQFSPEQIEEIKGYFASANYTFVTLSVICSVLSHLSRAHRWGFMLEPLGYKPSLSNRFMAISVAYLMNMFIPKSGEVSRGIVMKKYENLPFDKGFGTIIAERVVDLLFLLSFMVAALLLNYTILIGYFKEHIPANIIYAIIAGLLLLAIVGLLFLRYSKSSLNTRIKTFLLGLKEGVLSILKMKKKGAFIFHTFVIWGLYVLSFYVATFALEVTSSIAFSTIIIAFVVGSFTFAFTNSGFGTYPAAIAGILFLFAVPTTVGTAFGWIIWTSNIASIVIFGGLSFLLLPLLNNKTSKSS